MARTSRESWARTAGLALALLGLTLGFLQPLAHGALQRAGGDAMRSVWASLCLPDRSLPDDAADDRAPVKAGAHDCCLGTVQAAAPCLPGWVRLPPLRPAAARPLPVTLAELLQPVGIRDGPTQPHGPPRRL